MTYQPKGSMCAACAHKHKDCSSLPFKEMPVMAIYNGVKIVRCTNFERENKKVSG